jgi:predicted NAD/FAD-dependent oxidoreductase
LSRHVAIIGAGIAGLACARRLVAAGISTVVFEKSRGLGGRCATRRVDEMAFDHGAQYATAESPAFRDYLVEACAVDQVARWAALEALRDDDRHAYVGQPGMSALVSGLAKGCDVRLKGEVTSLLPTAEGWALALSNGDAEGAFSEVVLAVPAPQAINLLPKHPFRNRLAEVSFAPCWTLLATFASPLDLPDIVETGGAIRWAARNGTKPGRPDGESWVIQAGPRWSRDRLEEDVTQVCPELLDAFGMQIGGNLPSTLHVSAHRWRYARVDRALDETFLYDEGLGLGICGDGCIGPRIEAAFTSGDGLGRAMAGRQ